MRANHPGRLTADRKTNFVVQGEIVTALLCVYRLVLAILGVYGSATIIATVTKVPAKYVTDSEDV